jgi:excisionase family DNA binding protein
MQNIQTDFMTRRQVAEVFQVSPHTIIRWELAGRLPAVRLGAGSVRYRREDVQSFLANCGRMPTPTNKLSCLLPEE